MQQTTRRARPYTRSGVLKIIPLGGLEEVGKNCTVIEYDRDIIIIDLGLMFPNEEMPGIDYVVPDIGYLQKNKNKIRGVIITHGHLDHTGAIPYLIKHIGNPKIYATQLSAALIKDRLEEFKLEKSVKIQVFSADDVLKLGAFTIEPFRVNHNIPDSVGLGIRTPLGIVVHSCDYKFDHTPLDQKPTEFHKIAGFGGEGVLALMSDSTNAEKEGYAVSEKKIEENLSQILDDAKGRVIIATFASLISRLQQIVNVSIAHSRKVAVSGYSLERNLETAIELGYIKIPKEAIVPISEIDRYPDHRLTIISTGSQGQETSALGRMSRGEHRQIKIKSGDLVVLSSSPIPGNERSVQNLMNGLFRLGAKVIYNAIFGVHVSGHGYQEELKLMLTMVKPKYFMPIHGERHMLERHADIAESIGIPRENVFVMANGNVLEFKKVGVEIKAGLANTRLPNDYIMVDGLGVGDIGNVVLRDRQVMSRDGMFVIIVTVDNETQKLVNEPDIISRGFVYMKGSERLIDTVKEKVKKIVSAHTSQAKVSNWNPLRNALRDDIGAFLFQKTERRPMILPVVIEV